MDSLWKKEIIPPDFRSLGGDRKTDVLIIGGGLAGLLCAYRLKQAGVDCLLVEADRICSGITKNTTAKITVQHGLIYHTLIRRFGIERARLYLRANTRAMEEYRALCAEIDCDFEERDNYVYSLYDRTALGSEMAALDKLGQSATFVRQLPLPFSVAGAVKVKHQAQFHPLKFTYALARELPVVEQTKVLEFLPASVRTNHGHIYADTIIVATHFPLLDKHGSYFLKLYQHRSYVLALAGAGDVGGMYVDEAKKGLSFRNVGELLLLGGGSHRTGKKGGGWQELERVAARYYPRARIVGRWATQDCMSLDDVPYIGRYSQNTPNLFVASGFNKWGMTGSMVAASVLCDLVQGKDNPYAPVFDPSRSILRPQLAVNALETTLHLLKPTAPRCPHMGCALSYNKQEHTWDCPCHGSRFTRDGQLIDNPATADKQGDFYGKSS